MNLFNKEPNYYNKEHEQLGFIEWLKHLPNCLDCNCRVMSMADRTKQSCKNKEKRNYWIYFVCLWSIQIIDAVLHIKYILFNFINSMNNYHGSDFLIPLSIAGFLLFSLCFAVFTLPNWIMSIVNKIWKLKK